MGSFFVFLGVTLAGYAGWTGLEWYFLFAASGLMAIGYFISKAAQIAEMTAGDGVTGKIKLFFMELVFYTVISAPVFFVARAIN